MAIQLCDFAKGVLFGTTLEEKLGFPREEIVDTDPGKAIATPTDLARPVHLALRAGANRVNHPSHAKLIDEKERGRLLHFFGNHELLATELMALALLKFPDAPTSFRKGLLETLKEEQIHTKLYIHRMKQCGIEFGELPLSDYFWKSVSSMDDPLDYVTRLSLTFEQANLDYSRAYAKLFEAVGDETTAGILTKIYHDEIDHVGFGLKWFRRWKASGKSDWEAYRERLPFPLSPSRAKGNDFNCEGRVEAGFEESFIKELQIFHQSRGRTPSVFWFNPDAEKFASRDSDQACDPGKSVVQNDLAFLAAYLARRDDLLILPDAPSPDFLRSIQSLGFPLPEIQICGNGARELEASAITRKIGDLRPWAWTPDSVSYFKNAFKFLTRTIDVGMLWNDEIRKLFSKSWSAEWGRELAAEGVEEGWIAPPEVYGRIIHDVNELRTLREYFASLGYRDVVCKAPFAAAAVGNRCIMAKEEITPVFRAWLEGVFDVQGEVIVEPWLNRVYDFSVQFEKRNGEMKALAFTRLINNSRGQFQGAVVNGFCRGVHQEVTRFLMKRISRQPRVFHFYEETVGPRLATALTTAGFNGPLGIDAFVYRDSSGELRLKTVVEVNPRYTMGRIGHELGNRVAAGSVAYFQILNRSQIRKIKKQKIDDFAEELKKSHPMTFTNESKPRLQSGSFPLNDPKLAEQFLAVFHVRERIEELPI